MIGISVKADSAPTEEICVNRAAHNHRTHPNLPVIGERAYIVPSPVATPLPP